MSVKCMSWAWQQIGLTPTQKLLLMKYADYANDEGEGIFPARETLVKYVGVSDSTIRRTINELIGLGLIQKYKRTDRRGRQTTNGIKLLILGGQFEYPGGQIEQGGVVTAEHPGVVTGEHLITLNHQKEPSERINPSCSDVPSKREQRKYKYTDSQFSLAGDIWKKIRQVNPTMKPPNLDSWANDIRLMVEQDDRALTEIYQVFIWANRDDFWKSNILSTSKLRKQFDSLTAKMRHARETNNAKGRQDSKPSLAERNHQQAEEARDRILNRNTTGDDPDVGSDA